MNRTRISLQPEIYLVIALISILFLPVNVWAAQTVHIFLEIDGTNIEGDSTISSLGRENTIEAVTAGFSVITPREASSGALTGRRMYRPFTILKRFDKSTPLLFRALANNEPVNRLEARFYRPSRDGSGAEEHYYTMILEFGYVASIVQTSDAGSASPAMELVSFVYQNITMTYEIGGATHTDTWSGQQ